MFRDEYGNTREWVGAAGAILAVVLAIVAMFGLIAGLAAGITYAACDAIEEQTELVTAWDFWGGCFVVVGDRTIPLDNWRLMEQQ